MTNHAQSIAPLADVSRETVDRLCLFEQLIRKWNPTINLVSKSSLNDVWMRHIADSAQLYKHIPDGVVKCVDLGSGGGLPGIVLAAISVDQSPERHFTLVESDQRKAAFLREAVRTLGINAAIIAQRAETLEPQGAELVSARALAPLSKLLTAAQRHLAKDGVCLFPKGENFAHEIDEAKHQFEFECKTVQSLTDPSGVILIVHGIRNA
ncbi:16S rRNA (guanine(527)-N(7))-methyltransferase RsmG [Pseudorhodobacter ferrugineus]|uniref:16S rRNA (guanine(527)-N(7))-methyltransferase RsmG n=1 Tax=Pseudorhodobacter ferrugineus TaxID=77008 RepID=UPI0003B49409|nr:16S rRNA (guanine(527)-N(7))-methyltransferase RsmG [Pseudorhodobacter ferrugineus]